MIAIFLSRDYDIVIPEGRGYVMTGTQELHGTQVAKRDKIIKTMSYYLSFIALGFVIGVIGPTLPGLAENTGTRFKQISYLFTTHSFGYLAGSLLCGHLFDRVKGHPLIGAALVIMTVVMLLVPVMSVLWVLVGILFVIGMAEAAIDVGGNTLLVWLHGEKVGPFMNGLHFFFGLGALIAPMVVAKVMVASGGFTRAYWILAGAMFPLSILFFRLRSPKIRLSQNEHAIGEDRVLVVFLSLFFFLHVGAEISYGSWIYSFAVSLNIAGKAGAAYLTSAYWGALTLGRMFSVLIAIRLKPKTMIIIDLAGCITTAAFLLLWPHSRYVVWGGTALMGLSIASLFPTTINYAERNMDITGRVTSWFLVGGGVGGMFFPWFVGQRFESSGPIFMPILIAIIFITGLSLMAGAFYYTSRHKKSKIYG